MYYVSTEKRNYNSVDSRKQWDIIRENWQDYSQVISVYRWEDGWQEESTEGW